MLRVWPSWTLPLRERQNSGRLFISFALLIATGAYVVRQLGTTQFLAHSRLGIGELGFIAAACALGTLLGALRLRWLARDLGHSLAFGTSVRTVALSQAAASLFFQIYGQIASRAFLLRDQGIPVPTTVLMTLLERSVGLVFLLGLAGAGAMTIFGGLHIDAAAGGADLLKILCGLLFALIAVMFLSLRSFRDRKQSFNVDNGVLARGAIRVLLLTAAIQATTLAAFTVSALALSPTADAAKLAAASTIVMLASALPISFGGWGVRELGAVFALGAVGVPADAAFFSALTVGIISLVAALALGAVTLARPQREVADRGSDIKADALPVLAWALPVLAATLIYFQLYVPMANGNVNVCLADPLILIGASIFVLSFFGSRDNWRVSHLPLLVGCCTIVVLVGFVHGWLAFGSNAWAMTKAFGWFLLVGYAMVAALIVRVGGEAGREAIFKAVIATFLAIACLEYALYFAHTLGISLPLRGPERAEGFAQDPNAFAFQCLVAMALLLGPLETSMHTPAALGACFLMLWLSASRSGWIAAVILLVMALYFRPRVRTLVVSGVGLALLAATLPVFLQYISGAFLSADAAVAPSIVGLASGRSSSNAERWVTIHDALALFGNRPVFGQGLGHFVEHHTRLDGSRLVVHSSYLWLMAEFGALGTIAFLLTALAIVADSWSRASDNPVSRAIILLLVSFAAMSLVHDLMYQRLLWFTLGAALAHSPRPQTSREAEILSMRALRAVSPAWLRVRFAERRGGGTSSDRLPARPV